MPSGLEFTRFESRARVAGDTTPEPVSELFVVGFAPKKPGYMAQGMVVRFPGTVTLTSASLGPTRGAGCLFSHLCVVHLASGDGT